MDTDGSGGVAGDAAHVFRTWSPSDPAQEKLRAEFLAMVESNPASLNSYNPDIHFTVSVLVFDTELDRVLLHLHKRSGLWLQFGGHLEPIDTTLVGAALREATEESGIEELAIAPVPVQLHIVQGLRCKYALADRHLDVSFAAVAPAGACPRLDSNESLELNWYHADDLPQPLGATVPDLISVAHQIMMP